MYTTKVTQSIQSENAKQVMGRSKRLSQEFMNKDDKHHYLFAAGPSPPGGETTQLLEFLFTIFCFCD